MYSSPCRSFERSFDAVLAIDEVPTPYPKPFPTRWRTSRFHQGVATQLDSSTGRRLFRCCFSVAVPSHRQDRDVLLSRRRGVSYVACCLRLHYCHAAVFSLELVHYNWRNFCVRSLHTGDISVIGLFTGVPQRGSVKLVNCIHTYSFHTWCSLI